jgi:hypothetical protein
MRGVHRIALVAVALAVALPRSGRGESEAAEAPIREFDIPTLERLAHDMYVQDKFAWLASDVLAAHLDEKERATQGSKGWITGLRDGQQIVRFVRVSDRGPEALYDVVFAEGANPTLSSPTDRTLSPEEIAQYRARTLALTNIPRRCSDRYNSVALKDPSSDGWLVWAMAASLDPKAMLIGGHYRFTISPDGQTVRARDALSVSCMTITNENQAGEMMNHLVSLTPVETHAFASLTYGRTFHVGTEDGRAWRVDAGRIVRIEQDTPGADGFAARALAGMGEKCALFVSKKGEKTESHQPSGSTKVIEATERAQKFSVESPPGTQVGAIACMRQDIVPSPNDYKVAKAGYAFFIADNGKGHPFRNGALFLANGRFQFQIIDGDPLTDELAARVRARLDSFERAAHAPR